MATLEAVYQGSLRCTAEHSGSRSLIETDAPLDNRGKGERFSPTDLVGAALGTCILTTMALGVEEQGINLTGTTVQVNKIMAPAPRRIAKLQVYLHFPALGLSGEQRDRLKHLAEHCPVAKSLHPDLEQELVFHFADLENTLV